MMGMKRMSWKELRCRTTLTLVAFVVGFIPAKIEGNPEAKRLYDDLLSNYNRLIRPVGNNTDRLTVKLGLKLSQLIDVVIILTFFYINAISRLLMDLFHIYEELFGICAVFK